MEMTPQQKLKYDAFMENQANLQRLGEITKDFAQATAGFVVPNLEAKKAEFRELLNKVRAYEGKEPRTLAEE